MHHHPRPRAGAALLALAATLLVGGEALAEGPRTDGVRINGAVSNQIVTGPGTNVASGINSRASTAVGSIADGVRIDGRLNITVQTRAISNLASGVNDQVKTSVGSVEEDVRGQADVVISTGQIINMSDRTSRGPACVVIGTLGQVPGC
jgi:hypothetical protein